MRWTLQLKNEMDRATKVSIPLSEVGFGHHQSRIKLSDEVVHWGREQIKVVHTLPIDDEVNPLPRPARRAGWI